jgi:hypothetical protein
VTSISLPLPPPDPHELTRRMRDREPEAADNTSDQHLVSQVLQGRFVVKPTPGQLVKQGANSRAICRIDLRGAPLSGRSKSTKVCAVVEDFVPYASTSLEGYWGRIETPMPRAFAAVDDKTLFNPDKAAERSVVRDAAALHYVRSMAAKRIHEGNFAQALADGKAFWRTRPDDLFRFYRRETGLYVGPGAVEHILDRLFGDLVEKLESGASLRERMEQLYERVRAVLETFTLEIWVPKAGAGEFLLGDAPAVPCDPHSGYVGLAAGVALLDADVCLALPLGPHAMAWLHRGPGVEYRELDAREVEQANALQVLTAETEVLARPGTAFEPFIEQVRRHQYYPLPDTA